jgi:PAS domain S-box-containing protein
VAARIAPPVAATSLADALVASSVDGLIAWDRDCRFTLWNPAMERLTGLPAAEVVGALAFERFPHILQGGEDRYFHKALAGETTVVENCVMTGEGGAKRYYDRYYVPLRDASADVVGGVGIVRDVTDRRVAELALQEREALSRSILENTADAIGIVDATGKPSYANPALLRTLGYSWEELRERNVLDFVHPDDLMAAAGNMAKMVNEVGVDVMLEARWRTADGGWRTLDGQSRSFMDREGNLLMVLHARDVTETKRARAEVERAEEALRDSRERLRASQKMEAIGRLAGGVAHDFNNLLSVVLSCAEVLVRQAPQGTASYDHLSEIMRAAERGAALTRQLLTFSRKQPAQLRVVDLNAVVLDLRTMLRRLIGEHITLSTALGERVHVRADPGQVEQVILNLVLNARDALGERGGAITLSTGEAQLRASQDSVPPGRYAALRVEDDGMGMTDEVKAHLFEPFFTTKPRGKGTGLGLATVYGIVKQSGGHVHVDSAPGQGSAFEVLLPAVDDAVEASAAASLTGRPPGSETVVLVEDEVALRRLVREVLTEAGYDVLEAANGEEALRACAARAQRGERVDLVLTDVVMPGMSGRQLAARVREIVPESRVLLMSGYDDDDVRSGEPILAKPFSAGMLARRVREVLDAKR